MGGEATTLIDEMSDKGIWEKVLEKIADKIDIQTYHTWFNPTVFLGLKDNILSVKVPNRLFEEWLSEKYSQVIKESLDELGYGEFKVSFVSGKPISTEPMVMKSPKSKVKRLTFGDSSQMNPKYTFESFVVGDCNEFAHAAAQSVCKNPAKNFNPLYIFGGVGLGKTHLMHAIGFSTMQNCPHLKVSYLPSERFMNELISSIRHDKTQEFRELYRSIDVLLVDDIQFIAGKDRTQEEFFHTFNHLFDSQKQIVISCDCHPRELPKFHERLQSRFEWGLLADIKPPKLETKIAILHKKAELQNVSLQPNVAMFIAGKIRSNIRELEGCLNRLIAFSSLTGREIDMELAKEVLTDVISDEMRVVTIPRIQEFIADHYKLKVTQLKSKGNAQRIAFPRQIAMYLSKKLTNASLPKIGSKFGGKHHSTVLHSIRKIEDLRKKDRAFHKLINSFIESLT